MLFLGKELLVVSTVFLISGTLCLICWILLSGESGSFQNEIQFATNLGTTERFSSLYNSSKAHRRQNFYRKNSFSIYFVTSSLFGVMCAKKQNFVDQLSFLCNQDFWKLFQLSKIIGKSSSYIERSKFFIDHFGTIFRSITHLVLTPVVLTWDNVSKWALKPPTNPAKFMFLILQQRKHDEVIFNQWRGEANKKLRETFLFQDLTDKTATCICWIRNQVAILRSKSFAIAIEASQWLAKLASASSIKIHNKEIVRVWKMKKTYFCRTFNSYVKQTWTLFWFTGSTMLIQLIEQSNYANWMPLHWCKTGRTRIRPLFPWKTSLKEVQNFLSKTSI